jgi:hypothetical protein
MTNATTAPPAPPLSGQDINLAASATRQLLIATLAPLDVTFEQWTVINQVGSGQTTDDTGVRARLVAGLQLSDAEIDAIFLAAAPWVARDDDGRLTLTDAGRDLFAQGSTIVAGLVAELYAGFSPEELARTRQILVEVTARAAARLAAAA